MLSESNSIPVVRSVERRATPRLPTAGAPARIAWQEGGFRMRKAPARLIDITGQGAGLLTHRPAKLGQKLWLGVASLPCEWVKAIIRAAVPDESQWRYHLSFCEPCPAGLLERATAAQGIGDHPFPRILSDDEEDEI